MKFHGSLLASSAITALLVTGLVTPGSADDMPKRKSGLWEITMQMQGMPNMGPIQHCIDQNTDNLMQQKAEKMKPDCSVMDIKHSGSKVTVHSICTFEQTTITTDGVFEGAFDSAYKGTLHSKYNPQFNGKTETNMTQEARWLGPCQEGQKPGDVIMPTAGTGQKGLNINEMMNDPKIQELIKKQKQSQ